MRKFTVGVLSGVFLVFALGATTGNISAQDTGTLEEARPLSQRLREEYVMLLGPGNFAGCYSAAGWYHFKVHDKLPPGQIKLDIDFPLLDVDLLSAEDNSCSGLSTIKPKSLAARLCAVEGVIGGQVRRYTLEF